MLSSQNSQVSSDVNYIEDVFSTYLYTGNGTSQTITNGVNLSANGGLVWIKARNSSGATANNRLWTTDLTGSKVLQSDSTAALYDYGSPQVTFNSNGLGLSSDNAINGNALNFVSWTFRKQPKFFDVVTFTGDGRTSGNAIINHNLGVTPAVIIFRQVNGNSNWQYGTNFGAANWLSLFLNLDNAGSTTSYANNDWFAAQPTSTTFTVGWPYFASGSTYVAYLFAHNAGGFGLTGTDNVISCGSFTTDGTGAAGNITLGYEAQWVLIKRSDGAGGWNIIDTMRGSSLTSYNYLSPNTSGVESSSTSAGQGIFPTATGFFVGNNFPAASATYIYIAIRRGPMKVPTLGTSVYNAIARTGTGATANVTGVGFPPDLVIPTARTVGWQRGWYDRLRGVNKSIASNDTGAELTTADSITAFGQDGATYGSEVSVNASTYTFANWFMRRAPGFFDEVCYTGTGSATTITHNLTVIPELMIAKCRNDTGQWAVYSFNLTASNYLLLNSTAASATNTAVWNATAPTSSVFSVGTSLNTNSSGFTFVAYLFATAAGVSKVGSYTGTGALQTVACGFTSGARYVLIKRTDSTGDWYVWDSARGITSGNDPYLLLNSTAAEVTSTNYVDTDTTGFKVTAAAPAALNASGGTYIFLAIA